jgi:dihydrofolate reductase
MLFTEEGRTAKAIAGMTVSLDGFVADESGSVDRLYPDLASLRGTDYMNELIDETGAILMGKRTYEMAADPDWYAGNYEFQVPIFAVTHEPPRIAPKQDDRLTFTFLTDGAESAVAQARAAAQGGDCGRGCQPYPATPSHRPGG